MERVWPLWACFSSYFRDAAPDASEKIVLAEEPAHIAGPLAFETGEHFLSARPAAVDEFVERLDEAFFVGADRIHLRAAPEPRGGDVEHFACKIADGAIAERRLEREPRHGIAHGLAFFRGPRFHEVPRRVERNLVVVDSDP